MKLPCCVASKNVTIATEVVDAELPLLIGKSTLKKAGAVLHICTNKMELMGITMPMKETDSGHFSIEIKVTMADTLRRDETNLCRVLF